MYVKNLQGDVVAVVDESGTVLVEYIYSAYGEFFTEYVTSNTSIRTILDYSPFRYRGYMYDAESGFYYLNSRYYDPEVGRFVNADSYEVITASLSALTDKNLYAYCDNNPVMRTDHNGEFWNVIAGAVVGGISSFVSSIVTDVIFEKGEIDWAGAFISLGFGAATGALTAALPGYSIAISAGFSAAESVVDDLRSGKDAISIITNAAISAGFSAVSGSWGSDFANNSMYDDAFGAISRTFKGNHPSVKRAALETINTAVKHFRKSFESSLAESAAMSLINEGAKKIAELYRGRFR